MYPTSNEFAILWAISELPSILSLKGNLSLRRLLCACTLLLQALIKHLSKHLLLLDLGQYNRISSLEDKLNVNILCSLPEHPPAPGALNIKKSIATRNRSYHPSPEPSA